MRTACSSLFEGTAAGDLPVRWEAFSSRRHEEKNIASGTSTSSRRKCGRAGASQRQSVKSEVQRGEVLPNTLNAYLNAPAPITRRSNEGSSTMATRGDRGPRRRTGESSAGDEEMAVSHPPAHTRRSRTSDSDQKPILDSPARLTDALRSNSTIIGLEEEGKAPGSRHACRRQTFAAQ